MQIADLHIHSSYSRATAKNITIESLSRAAKMKGIDILGTGDFTHPEWIKELKQNLSDSNGIYEYNGTKFILSTEISLIYKNVKQRRIHLLLFAKNFEILDQINNWLSKKGRLDYDGRPIFGFSCVELVDAMMNISKDIVVIPAHAWTPWYGIFGSMSGFDSLNECFAEKSKHIFAIETGLSSDPPMNWRLSQIDNISLVSFSDAHSLPKLGREFCAFDLEKITYDGIFDAIKHRKKFLFTGEVPPAFGKYHYDGHRNCGVSLAPNESKKYRKICPRCSRPLTIGVEHRVEDLADRENGYKPENTVPFKTLIPLDELIAFAMKRTIYTKTVKEKHQQFVQRFKSEMDVLLNARCEELAAVDTALADIIIKNRNGEIHVIPGYDGVYGKPSLGCVENVGTTCVEINNTQKNINQFF